MNRDAVAEAFRRSFGGEPDIISIAPGRVNLIGEHTDYNDGFVFPVAIDRSLLVAARVCDGPSQLISSDRGRAKPFDAATVEPGQIRDWAKYAAGMAWVMRDRSAIPNIQGIVHSDVPIGSGVSSSAALEMAFGVVYRHFAGVSVSDKELALLGQKDENQFVGVNTGIMDQMASAMGREGKAMFLDTRSLDITYASVPEHLAVMLCDTKTPRALTSSAYNERRSQCEEAAKILGVRALRDASLEDLELKRDVMTGIVYRRARHVITENSRCQAFAIALESNQIEELGRLMKASHTSLRDDYEVSSNELNAMAEASWLQPGCVGARMTGAGFGGACVALVEKNKVDEFAYSVNLAYEKASGIKGEILSCRPVDGARVLWQS
jgi:galactokinase